MLLSRLHWVAIAAIIDSSIAEGFHRNAPKTGMELLQQGKSRANNLLAKRADDCGNGMECRSGLCCGTGCAYNCCAHDQAGISCGDAERCDFDGNVFIGCCPISAIQGCTGTATSVYVYTPFSTITMTSLGNTYTTSSEFYTSETEYAFPTSTTRSFGPTSSMTQESTTTASATSTPSSSSDDDNDNDSSSGTLSTGAKAGIGVGAAAGGLGLIGAIAFFLWKRKRGNKTPSGPAAYAPAPVAAPPGPAGPPGPPGPPPPPMSETKQPYEYGKPVYQPVSPGPPPVQPVYPPQPGPPGQPYYPVQLAHPSHVSELSTSPERNRYEMAG